MLKIKDLVLNLFKLKLRVLLNFSSNYINKSSWVIKLLLKKPLKLDSREMSCLTLIYILLLIEIDLPIKIKVINKVLFDFIVLAVLK